VLERSRFVRNRGNGIWFDIGNEHCAVRQCLIADNEDAGIFYEISFGLQAADNVITGNGFAATPGAWGAQAGISLSSSPECVVERNLILGNREGFNFREQARSTPRIGVKGDQAVWNHDQVIRNNVIAFNRDAQIWGWFDMKDNRHWPSPEGRAPRVPNKEQSNSQQVRDSTGVPPKSLTLEALRLQFEDNVYWAAPGQGLFQWGTSWGRHEAYTNLLDFQTQLKIDVGSRVVDPGFTDLISRDYRVPPATLGELEKTYPRGPIPGAVLGSHVPIAKPGK